MSHWLRSLSYPLLLVSFFAHSAPLQVAVSIKPLHGLVGDLGGRLIAPPTLLIQEGLSPHDATLRPSEVKALNYADLVIWIGPSFETCMTPYMTSSSKQLTLLNAGLSLKPIGHIADLSDPKTPAAKNRASRSAHMHAMEDHHGHDHHHEGMDPHFWLDPILMKQVATAITQALIARSEAKDEPYLRERLETVHTKLDNLHATLKARLAPSKGVPFMVFHDSYRYFSSRYGLNLEGSFNYNPHLPLSGKKINEMKAIIEDKNIHCLFTDTETHQNTGLFKEFGVKTPLLDPLGSKQLPQGIDGYSALMNEISLTVSQCLASVPESELTRTNQ